jgi:hypothetical protein
MERIIGIALSRYLATYIKNFSASQFQNWSLKDLGAPQAKKNGGFIVPSANTFDFNRV